jgi:3-phosphoshikimate 1-carboxyvinyltransferase
MLDSIPLLKICCHFDGMSIPRRGHETDAGIDLTAMAVELTKLGAQVTEGEDFLEIESPTELNDAIIDTYDDHRMAMCFSLTSLNSDFKKGANIVINDPNCVNKTFPNYFKILNTIIE